MTNAGHSLAFYYFLLKGFILSSQRKKEKFSFTSRKTVYQKLSYCSLFHLRNLDLWCRQDWGGDEEDEEDGRVGGEFIMMISNQLRLALEICRPEDFIPEARQDGTSANKRHNDFNQNMDHGVKVWLTCNC